MIMGSNSKLEIGKKYIGVSDKDRNIYPNQPFIVIREATFEEWISEYNLEVRIPLTNFELVEAKKGHFYEISID